MPPGLSGVSLSQAWAGAKNKRYEQAKKRTVATPKACMA
jgi:hypothetical protein